MSTYDDGESFADDDPEDLLYNFPVDRFRNLLSDQLQIVVERGFDLDPEQLASNMSRRVGVVRRDGTILENKLAVHAKVQQIIDTLHDPDVRARVANEILVLLQQTTDLHRGAI